MKKAKKLVAVLLFALMAAGLVACGDKSGDGEYVKLVVWAPPSSRSLLR